jgi:hypothetical protein
MSGSKRWLWPPLFAPSLPSPPSSQHPDLLSVSLHLRNAPFFPTPSQLPSLFPSPPHLHPHTAVCEQRQHFALAEKL